jgi:hypothetical protein
VQGELQLCCEWERLPQSAAEAALQRTEVSTACCSHSVGSTTFCTLTHHMRCASWHQLLELVRYEGPQWLAPVAIVCQTPPPLAVPLEIDVSLSTLDGTALAGLAYLSVRDRSRLRKLNDSTLDVATR